MPDHSIRTVTVKLYPNAGQEATLTAWLRECSRVYNRALEHRIKAYRRRGESVSRYRQQKLLTEWRERMPTVRAVPCEFARSPLRRLELAFAAFFARIKAGAKQKGFPRFKSFRRYNSMEYLVPGNYRRSGAVFVPGIGLIRARGLDAVGKQKSLRIIRRPSGWYAQIVVEGPADPSPIEPQSSVGIDVGLTTFATLSTGEKVENPRFGRKMERKLRAVQRRVSRRIKGSANRRKAVKALARVHERIAGQRRAFAHAEARKLVNRFDLIGFEDLNIAGMAHGKLAKSIMDAAWGFFLFCITFKAANAGKWSVPVNARGTSQECPFCGAIKAKSLFERRHECPCGGVVIDRDYASALVIETRALAVAGALRLRRDRPLTAAMRPPSSRPDETGSPTVAPMRC